MQYTFDQCANGRSPKLASLTALFTFTHLARLTLNEHWLDGDRCVSLFTRHRLDHPRCLELKEHFGGCHYICPQTDVALLSLVKPADKVVAGREQRQAARAAKRRTADDVAVSEVDGAGSGAQTHDIPAGNATNFPALECLDLPYCYYNLEDEPGTVSAWMRRQLRRSYEYEVAAEWEADQQTLGQAELVSSMA